MARLGMLSPSEVTEHNDATPIMALGDEVQDSDGNVYKYVQVSDADPATIAGGLAYYTDTSGVKVTMDNSAGLGANLVAGVFTKAAVTVNYYTFIQVEGIASLITDTGDDIALNDPLISHATQDGTVDRVTAAGFVRIVGYAMAADSDANNTVTALLTLR